MPAAADTPTTPDPDALSARVCGLWLPRLTERPSAGLRREPERMLDMRVRGPGPGDRGPRKELN